HNVNEEQIKERLAEGEVDQELIRLQNNQSTLSSEIQRLSTHLNEHEATKHSLLEKINDLEKEKQKQNEHIKQLHSHIKEKESTIQTLQTSAMEVDADTNKFEAFLDLRKRLRRSIFRGEEYSHDADVILSEVEQFKGVTFELVKQTSMGKLMKLITQRTFKTDPYHIHQRSTELLKHYAKLSIPVLAPTQTGRGSMVVLSVNAGREEELIMEMRGALSTLQEENTKLKQKLKLMQEGFKRLKEAIEHPSEPNIELDSFSLMDSSSDHVLLE
ncbi:hypothetical protein CU098_002226, partial [Rhizopus stolonifer]